MFERLKSFFNKPEQKALQSPNGYSLPMRRSDFTLGNPTQGVYKDYLKQYADSAWVYSCVHRIATKGASVPLKLYKTSTKKNKIVEEEILNHPILQLINRPNRFMTRSFFQESVIAYWLLTGNAYVLMASFEQGTGKPLELFTMRPDRMKIMADPIKFIAGYEYDLGKAQSQKYTPEQILHFKFFNSSDEFYGLAPLAAARLAIDTQQSADSYNFNFFTNSALPSGAIVSPSTLTKELRKEIMHAWKSMYGGTANAHKVALLEGGMDWKNLGISQKDMEFIQSKKLTREDILSVFGVPPIMAGVLEYSNYSVAKQQREIFWRDTMMPILSAYIDVLNYSFVKVLDETLALKCDYTNIPELQDDQKLVAETDEIYTRSGVKTINEVRERLGLEPVPYGNTWNVGLGIAPIGGSSIPPIAPEPNKIDATNEEMPKPKNVSCGDPEQYMPKLSTWTKRATLLEREVNHKQLKEQILKMATDIHEEINLQLRAKDFVKALDNGASISKEAKRYSLWVEFKDFTEEKEKHFMVGLRKEFNKQHEEVLNNIEKVSWPKILQLMRFCKKNEEDDKIRRILFNDSEAIKRSRELGNEEITNILKEKAIKELEKLNPGISFDVTNPKVAKWIDEKAFKFAKEITDTTQDKLRKTLKEAIDEGESIDQVEKRIGDVFDIAVGSRTEMIARTETISASNAGSLAAYEQSGVVEKKEWLATQDDRTRESHLAVDGETVGIDERFSNGLLFPGDPSGSADEVIQCRCTLLASQITEQE